MGSNVQIDEKEATGSTDIDDEAASPGDTD